MNRPVKALVLVLAGVLHAGQVAPGVRYRERQLRRPEGPVRLQILEVDPSRPAVNLLPVRALDRGVGRETVSSMVKRYGAVAGVNGGYFEVSGPREGASTGAYQLGGGVISAGAGRSALIFCRETGFVERAEIDVVKLETEPAPVRSSGCEPVDIIAAGPRLVRGGRIEVTEEGFRHPLVRHPRTAFALTRRGSFLLVTVDGRQASSIGLRLDELAAELVKLGAVEALNLDGGGSTTMVVRGAIRNAPSDGRERPVGDGILVFSVPHRRALLELMTRLVPAGLLVEMRALLRRGDLGTLARLVDAEDGRQLSRSAARLLREGIAGLGPRSPKRF